MKIKILISAFFIVLSLQIIAQSISAKSNFPVKQYINNRTPLRPNPYVELPLGAIKPEGWLKEMLIRQKNGATGKLDQLYPLVMNERNGWLGGY